MPVSLDSISPRDGFLDVLFSGSYDGQIVHFPEYLQRILEASRDYDQTRILMDFSSVRYVPDILTEHMVGERLSQLLPPTIRCAYVAPRTVAPQPSHFETVAVNRGARLRVFWNRQEALQWLLDTITETA
jgi:hypothetical protein